MPAEISLKAMVIFGKRVVDWVVMDYHFEDGSGFQRFFGTDVMLGEW